MKEVSTPSSRLKKDLGMWEGVLRKKYKNLGRNTILSRFTLPAGVSGRVRQAVHLMRKERLHVPLNIFMRGVTNPNA